MKLENVKITLFNKDNHFEINTDKQGQVSFKDIPEDIYNITAEKEGYETYISPKPVNVFEKYTTFKIQLQKLNPKQVTQKKQSTKKQQTTK